MVRDSVLIGAAGLLAVGAWLLYRGAQAEADQAEQDASGGVLAGADDVLTGATQTAAELVDTITSSTMRLSNMSRVTAADVQHPNVRALLAVIRRGEGTAGPNGYRTLFGGALFDGYADHPRRRITRTMGGRPLTSTAAGAYQFLSSTWDETARLMGLRDFSPANQDLGAVGRIAARGALEDAKAGRINVALRKIAKEWASMPGSPYGQPVITEQTARTVYASAGGTINA
jgi:muramidase (phage lysozyme)